MGGRHTATAIEEFRMDVKNEKEEREHWLAICRGHRIIKPKRIAIELSFAQNHFEKIKQGFFPRAMEDKWVIYYSRSVLYFHRSWTGYRIYTVKILRHENGYAIREFYVERNANIYSNTDDNEDIATITFLIANLLGIDVSSIFTSPNMGELDALKLWGHFGKMLFGPDCQDIQECSDGNSNMPHQEREEQHLGNNTPHSSKIIKFHPDFESLKTDVDKLRTELSMLVLERDALLYQECKNIEMAYMLSIGALEYKVYEIKCAILRLKRKMELIQAKKNRQEKIILSQIEASLDAEFAEYQAKLNEQVEKMNAALERSHGQLLTKKESRELKKLYHTIVKALHPDLHPDLIDAKIQLFHNAVEAYKSGDLNRLRIIDAMVSEPPVPTKKSVGLTVLMKEKERLTTLLQSINDSIAQIKSEFPYTMKSLVHSPEKIEARKTELEKHIMELSEVLATCTARMEKMLR